MSTANPWVNLMLDGDSSISPGRAARGVRLRRCLFFYSISLCLRGSSGCQACGEREDTARLKKSSARTAADVAAQRKKQVTESLKDMELRAKSREKGTLRTQSSELGSTSSPAPTGSPAFIAGIACGLQARICQRPVEYGGRVAGMLIGGLGLPRLVLSKLIKRRQKNSVGIGQCDRRRRARVKLVCP